MPASPTNVRVRYVDGTEIPVELVYAGPDEAGIHHWRPTIPVDFVSGMIITCSVLPAHTAIDLEPGTK